MSGFDEIETAVVIRYPYLWSREASRGETEGRKGWWWWFALWSLIMLPL
ncbi:hypothetical protein [Rhizobium nepotum]